MSRPGKASLARFWNKAREALFPTCYTVIIVTRHETAAGHRLNVASVQAHRVVEACLAFRGCALNNDDRGELQSGASPDGMKVKAKRRRSDSQLLDAEPQIGRALRSVYDQTVGEAIPAEMLDLLGKLG